MREGRAAGWARAFIYLPTIVPDVAYALVWLLILNPGLGPLNLVTPTPASAQTRTPVNPPANAVLAECAPEIKTPVQFPARFAPKFPFPPGTAFFKVATLNNNPNYVQVVGYVPLTFKDSVRYLLDELPQAGYTLGRGDTESTEAASFFSGNGWTGGFRITEVNFCPQVSEWVVIVYRF